MSTWQRPAQPHKLLPSGILYLVHALDVVYDIVHNYDTLQTCVCSCCVLNVMPFFQRETLKAGNGPGNEANAYSLWSLHLEMSKQHSTVVVDGTVYLLCGLIPIDQRGCGSCLGSPIPIRSPIISGPCCHFYGFCV